MPGFCHAGTDSLAAGDQPYAGTGQLCSLPADFTHQLAAAVEEKQDPGQPEQRARDDEESR